MLKIFRLINKRRSRYLIPGLIEFECVECGRSFDLDDDLQSHNDHEYAGVTDFDEI